MSTVDVGSPELARHPLYARFSRRLRGMFIDWALTLIVVFGSLMVATALHNDDASRGLGIAAVVIVLLYEPLLVSRTGGTIGHHLTNLRVVDDVTGGNLSFLKAIARFVLKSLLGWYSFLSMAFTRRNQAVHDLVTRSTVQIRDSAKAAAWQFITERTKPAQPADLPSVGRRVAVTFAYLLLTAVIYLGIEQVVIERGIVSMQCLDADVCTTTENIVTFAIAVGTLVAGLACVILGWRAKLPGARSA